MKLRVLNIFIGLFIAACTISSCLDSDYTEYEYSSNASITAFSITDSIVTYYPSVVNGKDTTISKGVVGAEYPFVINQHEGLIYNADSLPVGTDISKVVVNMTHDGYAVYIATETDTLWSEEDSLNFESPVLFKILAQDGSFGRTYTTKINVHQQDPDEFTWTKMAGNFNSTIQKQKAIYANGNIYVFAEQESQVAMTMTTDGKAWTELTSINIPAKADYTSALAWGNQLYILADNSLYTSVDGLLWNKVETSQKFATLTANYYSATSQKMIGSDTENYYIESTDGIHWNRYETIPENFPTSNVSFVSYSLDTNEAINRLVLIGDNGVSSDTTNIVWSQLQDETVWNDFQSPTDTKACPKLENMSLIRYNEMLYAFGGTGQHQGAIEAFSTFYQSKDNGITWTTANKKMTFPEEFGTLYEQAKGNYSCIVDNQQFIWIMWSQTGEVWRGRINKLGFDKQ